MKRALVLARRGQGRVEPNPMVGCVLVKSDRIIAQGYHRWFGGPHAEIDALRRAGAKARGATAFVTLEPCAHYGKTPPCADALIRAGLKRVVIAMKDPFPEVAGRGIRRLRRAGIRVELGPGTDLASELNAPYLTLLAKRRPYVILKWAQSVDGKIATRTGHSQWISSPEARRIVHRLRARVDGILVGIRTVLADDPLLTARDVPVRRTATRIILDTRLRLDPKSALAATAGQTPVLVLTSRQALQAHENRAAALTNLGVKVAVCRITKGRLDLLAALRRLAEQRMTNLLVEGGGQVLTAFLDAGLADEAYAFISPRLIGGTGAITPFGGRGVASVDQALPVRTSRTTHVGGDTLMHLTLS